MVPEKMKITIEDLAVILYYHDNHNAGRDGFLSEEDKEVKRWYLAIAKKMLAQLDRKQRK